jgi:hypothetical protein
MSVTRRWTARCVLAPGKTALAARRKGGADAIHHHVVSDRNGFREALKASCALTSDSALSSKGAMERQCAAPPATLAAGIRGFFKFETQCCAPGRWCSTNEDACRKKSIARSMRAACVCQANQRAACAARTPVPFKHSRAASICASVLRDFAPTFLLPKQNTLPRKPEPSRKTPAA